MVEQAKAVIVIGLNEPGADDCDLVQATGRKVLLFKNEISLMEALKVDLPVEIDLNDEEAVVKKARDLQQKFDIQAVFTLNEYRVPLAARIAEGLELGRGLSYQAALNCRNKKRTRQLLAEHGVGSAQFALVHTPEEAVAALDRFSLPVVVKPSNEAGSYGVTFCHSADQVVAAVQALRSNQTNWVGQELDGDILLEEFLEGPEYSVEACTSGGQTTILAITEKRTHRCIESGHHVPAGVSDADAASIHELVKGALAALGVENTVTHTEVKLTTSGPKIIEVNARPGGDRIHLLVLAVTGYNLRELSLHLALGGTLDDAPRHAVQAPSAAIRFLIADQDGVVTMERLDEARSLPGVQTVSLSVKNGQAVNRTLSNYDRLGYLIAHGTLDRHAVEVAEDAVAQLGVAVQ